MLFKKTPKHQEPAPAKAADPATAADAEPVVGPDAMLPERRRFPRPLPVPEVVEQDWAAWVDATQEKNPP